MNSPTPCKHCGEPSLKNSNFCCSGCEAAYGIIKNLGLSDFYEKKERNAQVRSNTPENFAKLDVIPFVQTENDIHTMYLMVDGIHCAACVWLIEHVLSNNKSLLHGRVNMTTKRLTLKWKGDIKQVEEFIDSIRKIGYRLMPYDPKLLESQHKKDAKQLLVYMAVAGFAATNVMLLSISLWSGIEMGSATASFMQWVSALIALPAIVYSSKPFYQSAYGALKHKRLNMDVPITLAIITSTALSLYEAMFGTGETYFDSAITLLFFLLIGRYLDQYMKSKTYNIAENFLTLESSSTTIITDNNKHNSTPIQKVKTGDICLIHAGERFPVDGIIVKGQTEVDNSIVTGESLPILVKEGNHVTAGALNINGVIHLKAMAVGKDSTLSQISSLIENSMLAKNKFTGIADKAAKIYAPAVHLLAAITFSYWAFFSDAGMHNAILYAVAVLIVTCPCALALSVPSVHVALTSNLLKRGILIKNATAIERLAEIKHVVFDKTGTITTGQFTLKNKVPENRLNIAANLAKKSLHPLSISLAKLISNSIEIENVKEMPGAGLCGNYKGEKLKLGSAFYCDVENNQERKETEIWFKQGNEKPIPLYFEDNIKADAAETIAALKNDIDNITMLSGDKQNIVKKIADKTGIEQYKAKQTPQDKHAFLQNLKQQKIKTLMVGDGINDAPALAESYVSMSFSNASSISQNNADIILQSPHLMDIVHALRHTKKARKAVMLNFAASISYNSVAIPLAMMGHITPLYAAIFMSTSSLVVMLNALRLK